ncbi:MAG: hypothetical protein IRZ13_07315 [Acetobacteraceae bacterium]|nr:hypothetical protein [Acetobacteraceae bacterium]
MEERRRQVEDERRRAEARRQQFEAEERRRDALRRATEAAERRRKEARRDAIAAERRREEARRAAAEAERRRHAERAAEPNSAGLVWLVWPPAGSFGMAPRVPRVALPTQPKGKPGPVPEASPPFLQASKAAPLWRHPAPEPGKPPPILP